MLLVAFVQWWYGPGWRDAAGRLLARIHDTYLLFSVPSLLTTMFAPWRRIISSPGRSIGDRARATLDNLISRVVGFIVRLIALIAAGVIITLYLVLGGILLLVWPVAPLLGPILIVGGLIF
ncbi:MAG TPA: hypothetical protein VMT30_08435 [Candidatus Saccharimonadia bacterium]|nr:hypothetical protein [Candidatus Saccharimonadia bacterium]